MFVPIYVLRVPSLLQNTVMFAYASIQYMLHNAITQDFNKPVPSLLKDIARCAGRGLQSNHPAQ